MESIKLKKKQKLDSSNVFDVLTHAEHMRLLKFVQQCQKRIIMKKLAKATKVNPIIK